MPLMARMSDTAPAVRHGAARAFGALVPLLPLAQGRGVPEGLEGGERERAEVRSWGGGGGRVALCVYFHHFIVEENRDCV